MCTHKYIKTDRWFKNTTCNYSELYEIESESSKEKMFEIPHDENGKCIFHSDNIEWKQKNDFQNKLITLIEIINNDENIESLDFRDFIFVGKSMANDDISRNYKCTENSLIKLAKDKVYTSILKPLLTQPLKNKVDFLNSVKKLFKKELKETILKLILDHSEYKIAISNLDFNKNVIFNGSAFYSNTIFDTIKFNKNSEFKDVEFKDEIEFINIFSLNFDFQYASFSKRSFFKNIENKGLNFMYSNFEDRAIFDEINSLSYTSLSNVKFLNTLILKNSKFKHHTDFSKTIFETKQIYRNITNLKNIEFNGVVSFENTEFHSAIDFNTIVFNENVSFVDTLFALKENINTQNSSVNFISITIGENCVMEFKSTNKENKIFKHEVSFRKEIIDGAISFENVNFNKIYKEDRTRFLKLQKDNKIIIGSGCLKYLHQTGIRTIFINGNLQGLVVELMNTYSNFFIEHNGFNLGFEILERDTEKIEYFYFSDEANITKEQFEERLGKTEAEIWTIVQNPDIVDTAQSQIVGSTNEQNNETTPNESNSQLKNIERKTFSLTKNGFVDKFLYAKDLLTNMMSTFFKIGSRISHNKISEDDLSRILNTIHFNNSGINIDGKIVFQVINNNYNQTQLMYVNKNNILEIKGNNNFVAQDLINSNIDIDKISDK